LLSGNYSVHKRKYYFRNGGNLNDFCGFFGLNFTTFSDFWIHEHSTDIKHYRNIFKNETLIIPYRLFIPAW
jgi:hypothetical protein